MEMSPPAEVVKLRGILYRLFEEKTGWDRGAQFDMLGTDDGKTPAVSPQIIDPAQFAPELKETVFRARALEIARLLLGPEAEPSYEHAIFKPARFGSSTPWHQDEAFRGATDLDWDAVSIWVPLQAVDSSNGCLEFIPKSHCGPVLDHRSANNDPHVHALECSGGFDEKSAVPCPLPAGGATIHHSRTLHCARANKSDVERCAYVLTFKTPARPALKARDFHWNRAKDTPREARRAAWQRRGGLIGAVRRKLKTLLSLT